MEFTKQDLTQCENLIKALKKGSFTLEGMEVLALAQAMSWIGQLQAIMKAQIEAPPMKIEQVKEPVTSSPAAPMKTARNPKKVV